nr:hypothetical protein [Tanacetum cinerariifolium]
MLVHIIVKNTRSNINSKEFTLQLVYDVLRLTPFYKAFLVTADVSEIYIQELWATAMVHHHSIRFKMDNRKRIVNLEYFREMMHICPRLPSQTFNDLPFEEEIMAFFRFLGHSGEIRKLNDVNINKLLQPWRSLAAIINKYLSGKSTGYDSLQLSQAQILWGLYHKKNVDFAYLLYEDFMYQVEHKNAKKSNEMYCPRCSLRSSWSQDIRNSEAYKEYYAVASGATPPKTKASVRKTKSSFDTSITPPTTTSTRLSTYAKGKQPAKASKEKILTVLSEVAITKVERIKLATKRSLQQTHISQASGSGADKGTGIIPGVPDVPTEEFDEEISWKLSDEDDVDEGSDDQDDDDDQDNDNQDDNDQDEGNDDDDQDEGNDDDQDTDEEGNDDENLGLNVGSEEGQDAEDDEDELYRDVNINLEGRVVQMADVHTTKEFKDTNVTLTPVNPYGQQQSSNYSGSLTLSAPTFNPSTIPTISTVPQALTPPTTASSTLLQDLPNFGSLFGFNHRLKTFEANFSEFVQTNQFAGSVSSILGIVQRYMDQRMNEAVKVAVQIQSDRLRDEAQAENEEFVKNLDENIQKTIKEQVKEQVKVQVSKILPKIEKTVNEHLEVEVLTRSSNSSKTSYIVTADLSEMELKKILIEKMESDKSIHRSDEQRNLYKALVEAYESDKIILDTYGDIVTLKRRRDDDADKDEEPSVGSDSGFKRRREGKEPESTSAAK